MADKKKAKFFCEYCGEEVAQNAKFCKKCGRFFASVRCPACGHTGDQKQFSAGCPQCGYAVGPVGSNAPRPQIKIRNPAAVARQLSLWHRGARRGRASDESLPVWIYVFTAAILFGALAAFFLRIR